MQSKFVTYARCEDGHIYTKILNVSSPEDYYNQSQKLAASLPANVVGYVDSTATE